MLILIIMMVVAVKSYSLKSALIWYFSACAIVCLSTVGQIAEKEAQGYIVKINWRGTAPTFIIFGVGAILIAIRHIGDYRRSKAKAEEREEELEQQ